MTEEQAGVLKERFDLIRDHLDLAASRLIEDDIARCMAVTTSASLTEVLGLEDVKRAAPLVDVAMLYCFLLGLAAAEDGWGKLEWPHE